MMSAERGSADAGSRWLGRMVAPRRLPALRFGCDVVMLGGEHPVSRALRLWVLALAFLCVGRMVLGSIQRGPRRVCSPMSPTLIVGAGAVGHHVVRRLRDCPEYGLCPVGFLDADPMPY